MRSGIYRELKAYYSCSNLELRERVAVSDSHEGQRPMFTGLFVPVAAAVEVVREFVRSGERSEHVHWVTGKSIRVAERRHGLT